MITKEQQMLVNPMYAQLICESSHWVYIAQYLYASAGKIEPEINQLWRHMHDSIFRRPEERTDPGPFRPVDFQRVYLLLMAYCLENMLKGYLVKVRRDQLFEETKKSGELPQMLKTHDLEKLAMQCPLSLNEEDVHVLQRLVYHARWIGRYPYPLRADQLYSFAEGSSVPGNGIGWGSDEIETTKVLINKIAKLLGMSLQPDSRETTKGNSGA
jgi:hypothetical protein